MANHDKSFYLETYGCSLNSADSDMIVGRLHKLGLMKVSNENEADVIILNTCGVKEPTEDKIIHRLSQLSNCVIPVVVTGCLPKISFTRIMKTIPQVSALLGPQSIESIGPIIERVLNGENGIVQLEPNQGSKLQYFEGPPDSVICTIPICEGCLGDCAYCAVRFARGPVRSYKIEELQKLVKRCIHLGYREIRLTAQDAGAFGHDTNEQLVDLLRVLSQFDGTHRFRLGMFNTNLISDFLSDFLAIMRSEHFFKFFHIPVQSGSNRILSAMNRRYRIQEFQAMVSKIRKKFSRATIATDIIVGFPGETRDDFEESVVLVETLRPTIVNISKYGDRPGTLASKSKRKVKTDLKKEWSREMSKIVSNIMKLENESWVGWTGPALVTKVGSKGGMICRNESYKPIVILDEQSLGTWIQVKVTSSEKTHLYAEVV
jgi:threonylcarbamoyladenosine tRNA methylthiotransferase CDKAL1